MAHALGVTMYLFQFICNHTTDFHTRRFQSVSEISRFTFTTAVATSKSGLRKKLKSYGKLSSSIPIQTLCFFGSSCRCAKYRMWRLHSYYTDRSICTKARALAVSAYLFPGHVQPHRGFSHTSFPIGLAISRLIIATTLKMFESNFRLN